LVRMADRIGLEMSYEANSVRTADRIGLEMSYEANSVRTADRIGLEMSYEATSILTPAVLFPTTFYRILLLQRTPVCQTPYELWADRPRFAQTMLNPTTSEATMAMAPAMPGFFTLACM
jgi:hypothetical protein